MLRRTKIIATLGPASSSREILSELISAGVDVVRLNFSHGTYDDHAASIDLIREINAIKNKPITILQDLQGPKIRVGEIIGGSVQLNVGDVITITPESIDGDASRISVDYPQISQSVSPGSSILIDDGAIELKVVKTVGSNVIAEVATGGMLKPHKGVNLPGADIKLPTLTSKDMNDLEFGLSHNIDMIALSFVRSAQDILYIRQVINEIEPSKSDIPIIAKLERADALANLHEIIHAADGVMVARGDLGVELSPEEVPIAQKHIIATANKHQKVVITATQMLDSMIHQPRPTRAEASDVANAIFDGSDAVMLSGETAIGKYPIETVQIMDAIIKNAEKHMLEWGRSDTSFSDDLAHDNALYIARAACEIAHDEDISAIAVFTMSGRTARLISKSRPQVPILAFTPRQEVYTRLGILWGVTPYLVKEASSVEEMLFHVEEAILDQSPLRQGQEVVLVAGFPVGAKKPANFTLIHKIGFH